MGGFDEGATDWGSETEGPDARDGRRMNPTGLFTTFEAALVNPSSGRSDLGSEKSGLILRERTLR